MLRDLKKRMKAKGWSKEELDHLGQTLKQEKKRDYLMKMHLSRFYYWNLILVIILLNFLCLLVLSPFMIILDFPWIHAMVAFFALSFGFMVHHFAKAIDYLKLKHHVVAGLLVPALMFTDVIIFSEFFDFLGTRFRLTSTFNITYLMVFFVLCFSLPYIIGLIFDR